MCLPSDQNWTFLLQFCCTHSKSILPHHLPVACILFASLCALIVCVMLLQTCDEEWGMKQSIEVALLKSLHDLEWTVEVLFSHFWYIPIPSLHRALISAAAYSLFSFPQSVLPFLFIPMNFNGRVQTIKVLCKSCEIYCGFLMYFEMRPPSSIIPVTLKVLW